MLGKTNVGGGGKKLFAAIGVAYPAGAILTCTNGITTLKAKTTSGHHVFSIPKAGTWTVTCVGGSLSASQTVEIAESDKGALKIVTLVFAGHYYNRGTFADGVAYKAVVTPSNSTVTEGSESFNMKSPGDSKFEMYLRIGKVDLTYINKLTLVYSCSVSSGSVRGCIFVSKAEVTAFADAEAITSASDSESVTGKTIELDVSDLTGEYYIYSGTNSNGSSWSNSRTVKILEVRHE